MAHIKKPIPTIVVGDIAELANIFKQEVLPNAQDPTVFILPGVSGTLDPFTEEWVSHDTETKFEALGIVGTVTEEDMIFGMHGHVNVGDVKVTYAYDVVSGIYNMEGVESLHLLTAGISGVYQIAARMVDVIGDIPIYVDYALKIDGNGE